MHARQSRATNIPLETVMWGKILCFMGGAAVGYLAREQIAEVLDTVCDKVSDLMESDASNTIDAVAAPVGNEEAEGNNGSEPVCATEHVVVG